MAASAQTSVEGDFQKALHLQNAGRLREAGKLYRQILAHNPDHVFACHNLGMVVIEEAGPGAAIPLFWNALRLDPNLPEGHNSLGNAFASMNMPVEAEAHFRRAIALSPPNAAHHYNLGNLLLRLKRFEEAEKAYREALDLDPGYKDACVNLGNALRSMSRGDESFAMFQKSLEIDPDFALGHIGVANIMRDRDETESALPHYRRAVECAPDMEIAHFNLANVLQDLGHMQGAEAGYRRAIDLAPAHAEAYRHLVQVAKLKPDDVLVAAMREGFESPTNTDTARMHFGFALGLVFDAARLHDEAFRYFVEANRLKRKTVAHDGRLDDVLLQRVRTTFSAEKFARLPNSGIDDETPIFVVGMMRSGTTLTEQILSSHPDVAGAGELRHVQEIVNARTDRIGKLYPQSFEDVTAAELREMGEDYLSRIRKKCGSGPRRIVDKMPQNFLYCGLIHLMLPKARFVYLKRDPMDNGLSIFTIYFTEGHGYAYELKEIGAYIRHSEKMMDHWSGLFPDVIYRQQYEDLVEDNEAQVRKLLDFCGLPFDQRCLEFHKTERMVRTASASQVREKLNKRSIARWKPYERHLRDLKRALKES